jgi:hypothetical protein
VLLLDCGLEFVLVFHVGECQVRAVKLGFQMRDAGRGVVDFSFPFFDGVSFPTTSR